MSEVATQTESFVELLTAIPVRELTDEELALVSGGADAIK